MPIIICPACQRKARVADAALGRTVEMPRLRGVVSRDLK